MQAHYIWSLNGRPRYGILNDNRLLCKSKYKRAIRLARVKFEKEVSDKLANKLLQGDVKGFGGKWNTVWGVASNQNASIEGNTDPTVIANEFAHYFAGNFVNSSDNVMLKINFETVYEECASYMDKQFCAHFTTDDIKIAIAKLKKGQASGSDGIFLEHVLYASDALVHALTDLFNLCIINVFVSVSFGSSVIVPVVKDIVMVMQVSAVIIDLFR